MHCGGCNMDYKPTFFSVVERKTIEVYRRCQLCLATGSHVPVGKPPRGERYIVVRDHAFCSACKVWHQVDLFGACATHPHKLGLVCKQSNTKSSKRSYAKKTTTRPVMSPDNLQCGVCQEWKAPDHYYSPENRPPHARVCVACSRKGHLIPTLAPAYGYRNAIVRGRAWCTDCRAWIETSLFSKNSARSHGLSHYCNDCARKKIKPSHVVQKYQFPQGQTYESLFVAQRGLCAICKQPERMVGRWGTVNRLSVDHDHETGLVRGLLCSRCNLGVGYFQDCPNNLTNAIAYLRQKPQK